MGYFQRGSTYSSSIDQKRFLTVDYNLSSYIGIIDVGIIDGWTIVPQTGLNIDIIPGRGLINGFYSETEYEIIQRANIVSGQYELDVVKYSQNPQDYLEDPEKQHYIDIVQEYNPEFNPDSSEGIRNEYIKVAYPTTIVLEDDADSYIIATLLYPDENYFIAGSNYPTVQDIPVAANYKTYKEYKTDLDVYISSKTDLNNYHWQNYTENHFTAVKYEVNYSGVTSSNSILLGKVITRNGKIISVNTSGVRSLKNIESPINDLAKDMISSHVHGGSKPYDPQKINLQTDIRQLALRKIETEKKWIFDILENNPTGITLDHRHTYKIDSDGNGYTVGIVGNIAPHYHTINSFLISDTKIDSNYSIDSHEHSISNLSALSAETYNIYSYGSVIATQESSDIEIDTLNKTITFYRPLAQIKRTYSSTILYQTSTMPNAVSYTFTKAVSDVNSFMIDLQEDFYRTVNSNSLTLSQDPNDSSPTVDPFSFYLSSTTDSYSFRTDPISMINQSSIALMVLKNADDKFLFTPTAARNIEITMTISPAITDYDFKLEILNNTEVQGILGTRNILYINAEKFLLGELEIARIPFLNHIGRMGEKVNAVKNPIISGDGLKYSVIPALTENSYYHRHKLNINSKDNGVTYQTLVNNRSITYSYSNGTAYLVGHTHAVKNGSINDSDGNQLGSWLVSKNLSGSNSVSHTHEIIYPTQSDSKVIYSIVEDAAGSIYMGTSNGLYISPYIPGYLYVINGVRIYILGTDLWVMLLEAQVIYQQLTKKSIVVTQEIYQEQLEKASINIVNDGDSYFLLGDIPNNAPQDTIMIKKEACFEVPNFVTGQYKLFSDVTSDEIVTSVKLIKPDGSEMRSEDFIQLSIIDTQLADSSLPESMIEELQQTREQYDYNVYCIATSSKLQKYPIWNIALSNENSLVITNQIAISKNENLEENFYKNWTYIDSPTHTGSLRKSYVDSVGNIWIATKQGISIVRNYSENELIEKLKNYHSCNDIMEAQIGTIYIGTTDGIFYSLDYGKTWTKTSVIENIIRLTKDISSVGFSTSDGHTHEIEMLDILGNGTTTVANSHFHEITSWNVLEISEHTHITEFKYYAFSKEFETYISNDANTWSLQTTSLPNSELGDILVFKENVYVCLPDGLYKNSFQGEEWTRVFSTRVYSLNYSYDLEDILLGCDGKVYYSNDGLIFKELFQMEGSNTPVAYINDEQKTFEAAFNTKEQSFYFKDIETSTTAPYCYIDSNILFTTNGGWNLSAPYDIYIDDRLIYSTKHNIDNRISTDPNVASYNFTVFPIEGAIYFQNQTNAVSNVHVYDITISVDDSSFLNVGDRILIQSKKEIDPLPDVSLLSPSNVEGVIVPAQILEYYDGVIQTQRKNEMLKEMSFYGTIASKHNNIITLTKRVDREILSPISVYKINNINGQTNVFANIYEGSLSNKGSNSHNELEDEFASANEGMPHTLNNSYLGNLLQLTQAMRFVYPTIDSKMKKTKFYDMKYSWNTGDIDPYIGDYIDLASTRMNAHNSYNSNYSVKIAQMINKIFVGEYSFANKIFAATDLGIFYMNLENNPDLKENWFYIPTLVKSTYDLITLSGDLLVAATDDGLFSTSDLLTWTQISPEIVNTPIYKFSYRWKGRNTLTIPAHTATFANVASNAYSTNSASYGLITSVLDQTIYENVIDGRIIQISNAGEKSGNYSIISHTSNTISIGSIFTGETETINDVEMKVGSWWEFLQKDISSDNPNINNSILAGGINRILYCSNIISDNITWKLCEPPKEITDYYIKDIYPISNGIILSSIIQRSGDMSSYIILSPDNATTWEIKTKLSRIMGTIKKIAITKYNHSKYQVQYLDRAAFIKKNSLIGLAFNYFDINGSLLLTSTVINNYSENGLDYITVSEMPSIENFSAIETSFIIDPLKINCIREMSSGTIFYGTDNGLYSDQKALTQRTTLNGQISKAGHGVTINSVDLAGTIKAIIALDNKTFNLVINTSENIEENILAKGKIRIIFSNKIYGPYVINNNTRKSITGDIQVEISIGDQSEFNNIAASSGKTVSMSLNGVTILNVTYDTFVNNNDFVAGTLVISSTDNGNYTNEYSIRENTQSQIILTKETTSGEIFSGDTAKLLKVGKITTLYINSPKLYDENQFVGSTFVYEDIFLNRQEYPIFSNTINSINIQLNEAIDILNIPDGASYEINGNWFESVKDFNFRELSIYEDHSHNAEVLNRKLSSSVNTLSLYNSAYVDINIVNNSDFQNSLVLSYPNLLEGAKIYFYNIDNPAYTYDTTIVSYNSPILRVNIKDDSIWDSNNTSSSIISNGWSFIIDSELYGISTGINYNDFRALQVSLTENSLYGSNYVIVSSTSGMAAGDKIKIGDSLSHEEENYIDSVIDSTSFILRSGLQNDYLVENSASIIILRDSYTNNHMHMIINGEVETLTIQQFLDNGYNASHYHLLQPLTKNVKSLAEFKRIYAIGDSSIIYTSYDETAWKKAMDLNNQTNWNSEISGISEITIYGSNVIAGTSNGFIYNQRNSS